MVTERIYWNFKDTTLTRPDLDQFVGATHYKWGTGTVLRLRCRTATRDARKHAEFLNEQYSIVILIEEMGT